MTREIAAVTSLPTDPRTGLTLPLSKSLDSRAFIEHRAMVAFELEVLAKKLDRFGWERDRQTAAHDRLVMDWMLALQDYPLTEVQAACRAWVSENPRKMPNEGDILAQINAARARHVAALPRRVEELPKPQPVTKEASLEILAQYGFAPRRMGASE